MNGRPKRSSPCAPHEEDHQAVAPPKKASRAELKQMIKDSGVLTPRGAAWMEAGTGV